MDITEKEKTAYTCFSGRLISAVLNNQNLPVLTSIWTQELAPVSPIGIVNYERVLSAAQQGAE